MKSFQLVAPDDHLQVRDFAVTAWNLQGILPFQRWIVDIRLLIEARRGSVASFTLTLPFEVAERRSIEDLSAYWNSGQPLPQWFGRYDGGEKARSVNIFDPEVQHRNPVPAPVSRRSDVVTIVHIMLTRQIKAGKAAVVVLRFHVGSQAAFVLWKRSGLGLNGLIVDFRIEGANKSLGVVGPLQSSINVIVRAFLQPKFSFPSDVEAALVEHGSWARYLRRDPDLRGEGALVRFSTPPNHTPARLYLDLSREFGLLPFGNFLRVFVAAIAGAFTALWLRDIDAKTARDAWGALGNAASRVTFHWGPIAITGLVAVVVVIAVKVPALRRAVRATRTWYRRVDRRAQDLLQRFRNR